MTGGGGHYSMGVTLQRYTGFQKTLMIPVLGLGYVSRIYKGWWEIRFINSVVVIDQLNRVPVWNRGIRLVRIVVDETGTNL